MKKFTKLSVITIFLLPLVFNSCQSGGNPFDLCVEGRLDDDFYKRIDTLAHYLVETQIISEYSLDEMYNFINKHDSLTLDVFYVLQNYEHRTANLNEIYSILWCCEHFFDKNKRITTDYKNICEIYLNSFEGESDLIDVFYATKTYGKVGKGVKSIMVVLFFDYLHTIGYEQYGAYKDWTKQYH